MSGEHRASVCCAPEVSHAENEELQNRSAAVRECYGRIHDANGHEDEADVRGPGRRQPGCVGGRVGVADPLVACRLVLLCFVFVFA